MSKYDSDADVLRDLLNPSMIVKCELNNTNDYQITLTEEKAKASYIKITGLPDDALIVKTDEFRCARKPSKIEIDEYSCRSDNEAKREANARANSAFQGKHDENACADYVLLSQSKRVILYFELKSTKPTKGSGHATSQLKGAQCFMDCCKLYVKHFFEDAPSNFLENSRPRYFKCLRTDGRYLASDTTRRPRLTRQFSQKEPVPNTAEKAKSLKTHTISFKQIAWLKDE